MKNPKPQQTRRHFLRTASATTALAFGNSRATGAQPPVARLTQRLNPKIANDRSVAINTLKPNARDLQHGLELHADAIVFDSYGFSPRAAVDGDAIKSAIEAGASSAELQDLREDAGMTRYVANAVEQQEYRDAWRVSGVTCIFQNAGEEGQDPLRLLKRLARFTYVTDLMRGFVSKAVTSGDILQAKKENRHSLCFTGNGVPLTQQWVSVQDELRYVKIFYQLGIRMMHLTYQRRNMIGDGCAEKANAGLSDFGHSAIAEMNRVGVIPDCAHSGWQTSLEAAKSSSKPVVASHSTVAAIHPHIRSKPDEVIRAIADSGGYLGVCCVPRFLRGSGDLNQLLNHVDYIVKKFGADHVAIGTDVAYTSQNEATERRKIPSRGRRRKEFRSLWPDDPFPTTSIMTGSMAWTNWPLFTVGLVQRGHSDETIRKIIGGNVMRVLDDSQR